MNKTTRSIILNKTSLFILNLQIFLKYLLVILFPLFGNYKHKYDYTTNKYLLTAYGQHDIFLFNNRYSFVNLL